MKKINFIFLIVMLCLSFIGCKDPDVTNSGNVGWYEFNHTYEEDGETNNQVMYFYMNEKSIVTRVGYEYNELCYEYLDDAKIIINDYLKSSKNMNNDVVKPIDKSAPYYCQKKEDLPWFVGFYKTPNPLPIKFEVKKSEGWVEEIRYVNIIYHLTPGVQYGSSSTKGYIYRVYLEDVENKSIYVRKYKADTKVRVGDIKSNGYDIDSSYITQTGYYRIKDDETIITISYDNYLNYATSEEGYPPEEIEYIINEELKPLNIYNTEIHCDFYFWYPDPPLYAENGEDWFENIDSIIDSSDWGGWRPGEILLSQNTNSITFSSPPSWCEIAGEEILIDINGDIVKSNIKDEFKNSFEYDNEWANGFILKKTDSYDKDQVSYPWGNY